MGQESEGTCAIFDADDDHTTLGKVLPQVATIVLRLESATMNPYHHRQSVAGALGRRCDAEIETVFAHHIGCTTRTSGLWGQGTELITYSHTFPGLCRLRCLPAQVTYGWGCIGNGFIHGKLAIEDALKVACLYMGFQKWLCYNVCCQHHGADHQNHCK